MNLSSPDRPPPVVTIAMPVFNGGPEVHLAVRSLLVQSMSDWELLVMDDGSTDGQAAALAALGDPRIRVLSDGENRGLAVRLNQAIDLARGRYFARMDHDDLAHPDRLRKQIAKLEGDASLDLVACRCIRMNEDCELTGLQPYAGRTHEDICRHPWLRIRMAHPTWLGRIEWFRAHRYPDPAPFYAEDFELLLRAHEESRYTCLPELLMARRVRSRIQWRKNLRARLAQFAVQRHYFLHRRRFSDAAKAAVMMVGRLLLDGWRLGSQATGMRLRSENAITPQDRAEWSELLGRFKTPRDSARPQHGSATTVELSAHEGNPVPARPPW
ncbi:glycosyltransferase family 2 protein [Ramlibacter rhizophilus]|uniref:Glycosyltransferase family 2 protein n=1 Tax=Ramlibacter rhizophilus TaxID=1781167 RepID=A0A4Z0BDK6_9BURK|nr:glycosyltransferase family 2 protein [Ramlibacter rhizophilus]TFY96880.1 glycosyltransferase family 2 protein [Ramlibacter rhizophilus]